MAKNYIKAVVLIIILFFLLTFGIKNSGSISISYYFGLIDIIVPMYVVVYACLVLGVIIGLIIGFVYRVGIKRELRALEKENKEIKTELGVLSSKAAVPVYNDNMYVPEPKTMPVNNDDKHGGAGGSSAY